MDETFWDAQVDTSNEDNSVETHRPESDGWRYFTREFKRESIGRVMRTEFTLVSIPATHSRVAVQSVSFRKVPVLLMVLMSPFAEADPSRTNRLLDPFAFL